MTAYRLTQPFQETQATWINRQTATAWGSPGGDLGEEYSTLQVTNAAGAKVSWNVRLLVQRSVAGQFGSPQTRIALVDVGGGGDVKESYREYHSSEASTLGNRPQLTVTYNVGSPSVPGVIDVPAGGDLQQALNQVLPGGTVRLASGATYVGNFTLPAKGGTSFITITTNTSLPPAGTRIDPSYRGALATIRSGDMFPALATATGASYYRILGVAFEANVSGAGDVIALGNSTQATLAEVPHHIEIDRVILTGDSSVGQKRGISANAAHVVVMNSDFRDIKAAGQDSQAVAAWNTPGPIAIRNNYMEAAGENIMIGGAHISLPSGTVPSDITIEDNVMTKDTAWRGHLVDGEEPLRAEERAAGGRAPEPDGIQLVGGAARVCDCLHAAQLEQPEPVGGRGGRRIQRERRAAQRRRVQPAGPRRHRHQRTARAHPHQEQPRLRHQRHQLGRLGPLLADRRRAARHHLRSQHRAPHREHRDLLFRGSYYNSSGTRVTGGPILGYVFTNNLLRHNSYGIFGSGQAYGNGALNYYAPGAVVRRNVMATDSSKASRYPPDNQFPTIAAFNASFVNPAVRDYRLVASSGYIGAGLDGEDIGVAVEAVLLRGIK